MDRTRRRPAVRDAGKHRRDRDAADRNRSRFRGLAAHRTVPSAVPRFEPDARRRRRRRYGPQASDRRELYGWPRQHAADRRRRLSAGTGAGACRRRPRPAAGSGGAARALGAAAARRPRAHHRSGRGPHLRASLERRRARASRRGAAGARHRAPRHASVADADVRIRRRGRLARGRRGRMGRYGDAAGAGRHRTAHRRRWRRHRRCRRHPRPADDRPWRRCQRSGGVTGLYAMADSTRT